ncbi:hypothetical protein BOX15_Mlig020151g2 [Macrostomum lignano]|uniref:Tr-type G domain-containing protein n=2 Tax=Macrostomum lignano TaxID=282301 RepID=A0A1I8GDT3_9PLAT|nr:hypothetical protein BOX15_Mlig020151g2 [Macrostomum lignano]
MASMDRCLVTFFGDGDNDSDTDCQSLTPASYSGYKSATTASVEISNQSADCFKPQRRQSARAERRRLKRNSKSSYNTEEDDRVHSSNLTRSQTMHCSKSCGELLPSSLPPENDEGNIEYKLKLVKPTTSRLEHLVTQLKWRLAEGQGQAVYELGVEDNGVVLGLTKMELNESLRTLDAMCRRLNAKYTILRERQIDNGTRKAQEILIRRLPNDNIELVESRLAVLGNLDAGKSTLLGVLTQGDLDNGRGRARLNLFRHPHEIQTGYTSSVSSEILGFDARGNLINYSGNRCVEDILDESSKLYRLIDLAGHIRYQKTTLRGLIAHDPHLVMLVVSSVTGLTDMAQEHAALAVGLQVPFIVVITKIDLCDHGPVLASVEAWLKATGNKRVPLVVQTKDDAITAADNIFQAGGSVTPVFPLSCVTGSGLSLLTEFLNVAPTNPQSRVGLGSRHLQQQQQQQRFAQEFCVDSVASLCGSGKFSYVLSGPVLNGQLREGELLKLGPGVDGVFVTVRITGLNRNRLPCGAVQAGHWASVTVCLQLEDRNWGSHSLPRVAESFARRGAFLIPLNSHPPAVLSFSAEVALHCRQRGGGGLSGGPLRHNQPVNILCGIVCQQAIVSNGLLASASASSGLNSSKRRQQQQRRIDCSVASPVQVHLRFAKQAELLRPGDRLVLRSGHRLLGVGRVLQTNNLLES